MLGALSFRGASEAFGAGFGASALLAAALTGLVLRYATRRKLLDHPTARSSHSLPTPRGGGLAIIAVSILAILVGCATSNVATHDAVTIGVGVTAIAMIGWIDDVRGTGARTRLAVHFLVAAWTLIMFSGLPTLRLGISSVRLGPIGYVIGIPAIVWSVNLFNFMDGIDGLAGSQAVLLFGAFGVLLLVAGSPSLAFVAVAVSGACLGFLVWNWPPATIFMGDVASGALGYLVAALAIASENRGSVTLIAVVVMGGAFLCDATVTLLRRVRRGERLAEAHRSHAYQRLTTVWNGHRPVTLASALLTVVLIGLATVGTIVPQLLLPAFAAALAIMGTVMVLVDRRAPM